ncbi:MAG: response regulator [Bacteroidota bacterium]|nr:response regulator [Bacteroidota bacterium]MDP4231900.1 response regulator [Bacteroidota bacterium]MDP4241393.1 response regulator [Bacteroidota bacterium]MDP4287316.1 response regulator [Bacteroidota bacterium]
MMKRQEALRLIRTIAGHANVAISESDDGPNISVTLSLRPDIELVPPSPPGTVPEPGQRYRVLHIEDIGRTADLVYYYLRNHYDVDTAMTAEEGLKAALEHHYDYILTDLKLSEGMGGLELTKLFRQTSEYSWTPIIGVAGFATEEDVRLSMAAGCSAFLSKPFLKSDLLRILHELETRIIKVKAAQAAGA